MFEFFNRKKPYDMPEQWDSHSVVDHEAIKSKTFEIIKVEMNILLLKQMSIF